MGRGLPVLVTALMLITAGCFGGTPPGATDSPEPTTSPLADDSPTPIGTQTTIQPTDPSPPDDPTPTVEPTPTPEPTPHPSPGRADPEEDRLGWENGYWYDESVPTTPDDGYNKTEVEWILARSMARVERIRALEFNETPEVNFVPREAYSEWLSGLYRESIYANVTTKERLHQNTKYEALFTVPEDDSYYSDVIANQGGLAGAFYTSGGIPDLNVSAGSITIIVSNDGRAGLFRETALGHELVHRLQDVNLEVIDTYSGGPTEEAENVNRSLIEADATLVSERYSQRCEREWDCIPPPEDGSGDFEFANVGLYTFDLAPYSETANLFAAADERGGPTAMDAIYDNPPVSTEQLLHPAAYPNDTPTEIEYTDRSTDDWSMQTFEDGVNYASFGEMGIFLMLWYPSFDTGDRVVMDPNHPYQGVSHPSLFDFTHPASEGWDGDRLFIYTNDTSAETNETGYVWETRWDSAADATEFADAYTTILTEYGSPVDGRANTYRIPDTHPYGDAFYVNTTGEAVTIVNVPSVEDLSEVRTSAGE